MTNSNSGPTVVKKNWSDVKDKLKIKFPTLADTDLQYEDGKKDEMMEKIQVKLGKSKDEMTKIIDTL